MPELEYVWLKDCFLQTKHRDRKLAMSLLKGTLPKSAKKVLTTRELLAEF